MPVVSAWVDVDLYDKLKSVAERRGSTVSRVVKDLLKRRLEGKGGNEEVRSVVRRLEVQEKIDFMYYLARAARDYEKVRKEFKRFAKAFRNSRISLSREYVEKLEFVWNYYELNERIKKLERTLEEAEILSQHYYLSRGYLTFIGRRVRELIERAKKLGVTEEMLAEGGSFERG